MFPNYWRMWIGIEWLSRSVAPAGVWVTPGTWAGRIPKKRESSIPLEEFCLAASRLLYLLCQERLHGLKSFFKIIGMTVFTACRHILQIMCNIRMSFLHIRGCWVAAVANSTESYTAVVGAINQDLQPIFHLNS